mmetsp:Transcript_14384/g.45348  ORF Transcript_14384/g.45348 Transcript_14384/m.45348 type:complete len:364 (-) Transcript_14384:132-1223(-)
MASREQPLRVGICGCAAIAKKNARALSRASSCELVAVASRSEEKAMKWREEVGLPSLRVVVGYEALVAFVDAVYLPLPTSLHKEWVMKFAKAKKHILVEKPVGARLADVEEMVACCRENGVAIMDGTMFMHHARFGAFRRLFEDEVFWHCSRFTSAFTFFGGEAFLAGGDIRTRADGDPLGCLGDVGWYPIRMALVAFRFALPLAATARLHDASPEGVPFDMDVDLDFGRGRIATFHCSFKHHFRQWFEAVSINRYGSRIVRCFDFVIPSREQLCHYEIEEIPNVQTIEYDTINACAKHTIPVLDCNQELHMWLTFEHLCRDPDAADSRAFFERATLITHRVIEAIFLSATNGGQRTPVIGTP